MASVKNLARYIYENQKRGFSDIEIYQILEQSGWSKHDIDYAFKRAVLLKNIDLILSAPFEYLKKWPGSIKRFFIPLPLKILRFFNRAILNAAKSAASFFSLIINKIIFIAKNILNYIFITVPRNISLKLTAKKKQKIQNKNSILELSKYIEKNLKNGALENDIFIELLKIGWNPKIIDKAFSTAHFRILNKSIKSFLKLVILSPFILIKKIVLFIASILKKIFIDAPKTAINILKQFIIFIINGAHHFFSYFILFIKNGVAGIFKKRPKPFIPFKPSPAKISIIRKLKPAFLNFIYFWKDLFFKLVKTKIKITKEKPVTIIIPKEKVSSLAHLKMGLKYFIKRYPQSATRLKQRTFYSLSRSIKRSQRGLLKWILIMVRFMRYDLPAISKKIVIAPIIIAKKLSRFISHIDFDLRKSILAVSRLFRAILLLPSMALSKIIELPIKSIKKIDLKIFNIPFEILEFTILKIYKSIKIILSPIKTQLQLSSKFLRRLVIPISEEIEYAPQNLSEVPVGEVSDEMRPFDVLRIAARMFKTRRMRTFLTILGIGIGIGAILFLVSLGYGLQKILIEEIATSDALLSLDITTRDESLIPLDKESVKSLANIPEVSYISPLISVPAQISLGNITANTMVDGINPNYFKLAGITATVGNLFKEGETNKIIISAPIVKLLNLKSADGAITIDDSKKIIGQNVSITLLVPQKTQTGTEEIKTIEFDNKFEISGVMQDSTESLFYMPLSRLEDAGITKYQSAKVRVTSTNTLEPVRAKAVEKGFIVAALSDTIDQANKVFRVLQVILALFGIVALSVSAIGMFNTMTIALLERTQEIGIMKSLGASNRNVWELFLAESIIMGFLGGVGGISIGYISSEGFNLLIRVLAGALGGRKVQLFERPWWFLVTILVFSTVVGLFTGLWPAKRAARINILQALRYK